MAPPNAANGRARCAAADSGHRNREWRAPAPAAAPGHAEPEPGSKLARLGLAAVRYGIGVVMVIGGLVLLIVSPAGLGVDGFAMAAGGGLSVLLINFLYRLGVSGDLDRQREEQAWAYFERHGVWPDDEQPGAQAPQWPSGPRAGAGSPSQ